MIAEPITAPEPAAETRVAVGARPSDRLYIVALLAAVLIGAAVRLVHVWTASFPLNDGGLFLAMARDLQTAHYHLPSFTSYNGGGIPFAYPPLGFYAGALLDDATPMSLTTVVRLLPAVVGALSVGAFALLARAMTRSRATVVLATLAFALVPRAFIWIVMGGGLTRSFGLLFALLALRSAWLLYTERRTREVVPATVLSALTVLSHLETGWFLALSIGVFLLARGRNRHGLASSAAVAAGTLLLSAPWWGVLIARHGVAPLVAAQQTGGSIFSGGDTRFWVLTDLARLGFGSTSEPLFPVVGALAMLGAFLALTSRRPLLPLWWAATILLEQRAFKTFVTIPQALLAASAVVEVVLPRLPRPSLAAIRRRPLNAVPVAAVAVGVLAYGLFSAWTTDGRYSGENAYLTALSPAERTAMRWVAANTPSDSRVLVMPSGGWPTDRTQEWFPLLAGRESPATLQGTEWLSGGAFAQGERRREQLMSCSEKTAACLERWAHDAGVDYTHVYVPKPPTGECCWTLLTALDNDPRFSLVYDGAGATIFAREPGERDRQITGRTPDDRLPAR